MLNRRIIIIVIALFVLIALGALLYLAVNKNPEPFVEAERNSTPLKKIVDEAVISPIPSFDGAALWYFTAGGKLFRSDFTGQNISEFPLPSIVGLKDVVWPKTGNDFIAVAEYEGNPDTKHFYNNAEKKYEILPYNIQNFDWMPDGKRIIYIWRSSDNVTQQLNISNADGTGYKIITSQIFWPDYKVYVSPNGLEALLVRSKIEGDVNKIYKVNLETGKIDIAVGSGKNLDARWVDNSRFIYTQAGTSTYPDVYIYNLASKANIILKLNTTLDKVVLDKENKFAYAAVAKTNNSGDAFIKINLDTLVSETYFDPVEDVRAKDLHWTGTSLFFVNLRDGKPYIISK